MLLTLFSSGMSHFMQDMGGELTSSGLASYNTFLIDNMSCELKGSFAA